MNDFTSFDPYAGYARESATPAHAYSDGCGCDLCRSIRNIRAATCKCGHVGAECFNDSYCDTPVKDTKDHIIEGWQRQYADMKVKATENAAYARRLEDQINDLDSKLQAANANEAKAAQRIENQRGLITDLRAEIDAMKKAHCESSERFYAENQMLKQTRVPIATADFWRKAYSERSTEATKAEIKLQNRITELESAHSASIDEHLKHLAEWEALYLDLSARIEQAESTLEDDLNDLQADYAAYQQSERDVSDYLASRVTDLENALRVTIALYN